MGVKRKVAVIIGTRPEAIKLAPVVDALRGQPDLGVLVVATGQHRQMLDQALAVFGISPDVDLNVMRPTQDLAELTARLVTELSDVFARELPDLALVQGDTATVFAGALAGFFRRVPIGHVEAGLRSGDLCDPFPEEGTRRMTSLLATLHFAPTERARANLLAEGIPAARIFVTGNTVVDAVLSVAARLPPSAPQPPGRTILATLHRRESWGGTLEEICRGLRDVLDARTDVNLIFPVHPNPLVRETVHKVLGMHPRAMLLAPLDYPEFVDWMLRSYLIMTDSGGVQEEAPAFAKPTLILRRTTERPEAVEAGCARLVGTERSAVTAAAIRLLDDATAYAKMVAAPNPFGDGRAAARIVAAVRTYLGLNGRDS